MEHEGDIIPCITWRVNRQYRVQAAYLSACDAYFTFCAADPRAAQRRVQ